MFYQFIGFGFEKEGNNGPEVDVYHFPKEFQILDDPRKFTNF